MLLFVVCCVRFLVGWFRCRCVFCVVVCWFGYCWLLFVLFVVRNCELLVVVCCCLCLFLVVGCLVHVVCWLLVVVFYVLCVVCCSLRVVVCSLLMCVVR